MQFLLLAFDRRNKDKKVSSLEGDKCIKNPLVWQIAFFLMNYKFPNMIKDIISQKLCYLKATRQWWIPLFSHFIQQILVGVHWIPGTGAASQSGDGIPARKLRCGAARAGCQDAGNRDLEELGPRGRSSQQGQSDSREADAEGTWARTGSKMCEEPERGRGVGGWSRCRVRERVLRKVTAGRPSFERSWKTWGIWLDSEDTACPWKGCRCGWICLFAFKTRACYKWGGKPLTSEYAEGGQGD